LKRSEKMDTESKPTIPAGYNAENVVRNQEQQRLLGVVEASIHEIEHMIEQNEEDVNILTAILSLDIVLDRVELSLAKNRDLRRRIYRRSAGRGSISGTRVKGPVNRTPYARSRWRY
jgi:hypothetical protein